MSNHFVHLEQKGGSQPYRLYIGSGGRDYDWLRWMVVAHYWNSYTTLMILGGYRFTEHTQVRKI